MDELATKAIIIGVSIFVTLVIVTVLIFEFTQIQSLYKTTAETNVTFESKLDEFNKYKDSTNYFNGLDVKNTIEKYRGDATVEICLTVGGTTNCSDSHIIDMEDYNKQYIVSTEDIGEKIRIIFEKIM